jgi:hypothetical protein
MNESASKEPPAKVVDILRWQTVMIRGPRDFETVANRIHGRTRSSNGVVVRLHDDRVKARAVFADRTDFAAPVFRGRLIDTGHAVELRGRLRPGLFVLIWLAPVTVIIVGLMPGTEMRAWVVLAGLVQALVVVGLFPQQRRRTAAQRKELRSTLTHLLRG